MAPFDQHIGSPFGMQLPGSFPHALQAADGRHACQGCCLCQVGSQHSGLADQPVQALSLLWQCVTGEATLMCP